MTDALNLPVSDTSDRHRRPPFEHVTDQARESARS